MYNVRIFKTTYHMGYGIGFTDMAEELIAQALAFRRARYQACDIDKLHGRCYGFFRFDNIG